jgi:predicted TIM-barrel fold metal-dependent hydrolase
VTSNIVQGGVIFVLIDIHTHLALEEHVTGYAFFDDVERGGLKKESFITDYDRHYRENLSQVDKAVVFGLNAKASGIVVPNEYIAEYARLYPDKAIGFASVDPNNKDADQELEYCIKELGLKGLKLGPIYQHFNPQDEKKAYPVYETASKLDIPIIWHLGTSFVREGLLEYTRPALLERIALDFPELKMVIAHMGHPWENETIVLIRKQPNIYADVSALFYRPWQFYNTMVLSVEYKVTHKMFFGTDFPVTTPKQSVEGIFSIKRFWQNSGLPVIEDDVLNGIIERNPLEILGLV